MAARTATDSWLLYADTHRLSAVEEMLPGKGFKGSGSDLGWPPGMFGPQSFAGFETMGIHTTSQLLRVVDTFYKPSDWSYCTSIAADSAHDRFLKDFAAFHINRPAGVHGFLLRFIDAAHNPGNRAEYERRLAAIGYPSSNRRLWDPATVYPFFDNPYDPAYSEPYIAPAPAPAWQPAPAPAPAWQPQPVRHVYQPDSSPRDSSQPAVLAPIKHFFRQNSIPEHLGFSLALALAAAVTAALFGDMGFIASVVVLCVGLFFIKGGAAGSPSIGRCFCLAAYAVLGQFLVAFASDSGAMGFAVFVASVYLLVAHQDKFPAQMLPLK